MSTLSADYSIKGPRNMAGPIVECVPNFSEGTHPETVRKIVLAMQVEGVSLLDWSLDPDHNRSVVTIAGAPQAIVEAAVRGVGRAVELIDLTAQQGVHPRIGAADVVPLVPIQGISLQEVAMLAHRVGQEIWKRFHVPVYFYEAAATRPDRALLENVRRGQFEGLRKEAIDNAARRPDVGGPSLHPTAGACAVGARQLLIACNVYLNTPNVGVARTVAREVRASGGGLSGVKAIGVPVRGRAQVSMNITNFRATPVSVAYAAVKKAAQHAGVEPERIELIGLVPEAALEPGSEWMQLATSFHPAERTLERKLEVPLLWP
ncbi:MAG TPA: glutamate formimidoyltransferase [Acidobacteriaceae bacterium]|jgi:glutamate formiminotransferase|nr:glutamate formimidoyltransferase [Acidobacteriaceae bacterium]